MTRKSKIVTGLKEAVRHARGKSMSAVRVVHVPTPLDVQAIRIRQGLTQAAFAAKYGFSLQTLRNWEQGHRAPTGAARVLLLVIEKCPQAVETALAA